MTRKSPKNEQEYVINAPARQHTLVLAGPGTGKTETVARRLAYLIGKERLRPSQILVLSFSRSAVKALVTRIRSLDLTDTPTLEELRYLSVRTFDSWTFRMLRFLGEDAGELLKRGYEENIRLLISRLDSLGAAGALSKGELRLGLVRHFVVDEFQDLSGDRTELVQKLLQIFNSADRGESDYCGFTILGDPNQAIYDFSVEDSGYSGSFGTSRELTKWIEKEFKTLETARFTRNRRSTADITKLVEEAAEILAEAGDDGLDPAQELEEFLEERLDFSETDNLFDAAAGGDGRGVAVLCRSNSQILEIGLQLQYLSYKKGKEIPELHMTAGTPPERLPSWVAKLFYQFKAGSVTRRKFDQIFGIVFPHGDEGAPCGGDAGAAWELLLGYARSGGGETSLDMNQLRTRIHWPDSLPDDEVVPDPGVMLTTIHQSKGLEFQKVCIVKGNRNSTVVKSGNSEEEARVLFVGMSRAKDELAMLDFSSKYPFFPKPFGDSRERWHRWLFNMTQLELGCRNDIDEESIIRTDYMGEHNVSETQKFLAENERALIGAPITLEKTPVPGKVNRYFYAIKLNMSDREWTLGFLRKFVTLDVLKSRSGKAWLPGRIHELSIRAITSSVATGDLHASVPSPWRESRFWLSPVIHGIGKFK